MKRGLIFILLVLARLSVCSQMQITVGSSFPRTWTPEALIRNILLADGEEVYNVKFSGSDNDSIICDALGIFTTGEVPTNIGMSRGLLMATGDARLSAGPNNVTNSGSHAIVCANYIDPALLNYVSYTNIYDASILEFDFVPKNDTVKFRYVFASEEYPEYVGSGYNDIFGFFISGPNPLGGEYNNHNLGVIPNTNTYISINTVNNRTNSEYYVNNAGGTSIQYDGFTTVMTAKAVVVPCQTYHIKMAICDVMDERYNSAVFIEAESFSSNSIYVNFINPSDNYQPFHIYEGCHGLDIEFKRPSGEGNNSVVISLGGTATIGEDYLPIDTNIVFLEGDTMHTITITPIMDREWEGNETVEFIYQIGQCQADTVLITIHDTEEMKPSISYIPPSQDDTTVVLTAVVQNGYINNELDYTYRWNTGEVSKIITVPTLPIGEYWYEVWDKCKIAYSDTVLIGVLREFAISTGDTAVCRGDSVSLSVKGADYQIWSTGDSSSVITILPDTVQCYTVTSYKWWNNALWDDEDTVCVTIKDYPIARIVAKPDVVTTSNPITTLVDVSEGALSRQWNLIGVYRYENTIQYEMPYTDSVEISLIAYNDIMCADTTYKVIYMMSEELWIPNVFTPMADNNNLFEIKARNLHTYNIQIYNRNGEMIYESNDINKPWNGRYNNVMCMKGAYVYVIRYSNVNNPNNVLIRKGTVLLNM